MLNTLAEEIKGLSPEEFLSANGIVSSSTLNLLKTLYDFTKSEEKNCDSFKNFVQISTTSSTRKKKRSKSTGKLQLSRTELPLDSLIIESFDSDQVWEELQLQNALIYETLISSVSKILARNNQVPKQTTNSDSDSSDNPYRDLDFDDNGELPSDDQSQSDDNDSVQFEGSKSTGRSKKKRVKGQKSQPVYAKSIVDDKFFNLAQMNEFMEKIEADMDKPVDLDEDESDPEDEDEELEHFSEKSGGPQNLEEEEGHNYFYKDFFEPPLDEINNSRVEREDEESDEDEDDGDEEETLEKVKEPELKSMLGDLYHARAAGKDKEVRFNLLDGDEDETLKDDDDEDADEEKDEILVAPDNSSNFEKRRKRIDEGIELMEKEALEPKAWQFQGEVTANKRPENSLLEEHLIFDHLIRQAPEITAETTLRLEDIIKQRIKDQAWDDVIRKVKPVDNPVEYKKKLTLDSEKSRVGLANVYEEEYIKQKKIEDAQEETEAIPEEQIQIEKDLKILFSKLDALSNFHYTPKAPSAEIRVVTNLPSITIEEVAPVSVSDATLLAPQEIQDPSQAEIKGKAERTDTDKKRERRIKKKKQHIKRIGREEKARAKGITLEHVTFADKKLRKSSKSVEDEGFHHGKELKSSKAFFSRLQQEAQSQIKGTLAVKRKKDTSKLVAKKFKL